MASKISINLDTSKDNYIIAKCKQNDDLLLEANIFENGVVKNLDNSIVSIQAKKPDNTFIIQTEGINKENNILNINLIKDFTRKSGEVLIEIVISENGKQKTTSNVRLQVAASVINNLVESKNTVTILENLENKIVEANMVKEETQELIQNGGAATTGQVAEITSQLEQIATITLEINNNEDIRDKFVEAYNKLPTTGGKIKIPKGIYYFSPIRIGSFFEENKGNLPNLIGKKIEIEGIGDVELVLPNQANNDMISFARFSEGITIKNITFNGNKSEQTGEGGFKGVWDNFLVGVLIFGCENINIEKCTFKNHLYFGANISKDCVTVKIADCKFENCHSGINFVGKNIHINNCLAENCVQGIMFEPVIKSIDYDTFIGLCALVVVENCSAFNCTQGFYVLDGGYDITFRNNYTKDCNQGISINGTGMTGDLSIEQIKLENNIILDSILYGIYCGNVKQLFIKNNTIIGGDNSIGIFKVVDGLINNNIIKLSKKTALIFTGGNKNIIIDSNFMYDNNQDGLTGKYGAISLIGDNITVSNNSVIEKVETTKQNFGLILTSTCTNIIIKNNTIKGNKTQDFVDWEGNSSYNWENNITDKKTGIKPNLYNYKQLNYVTTLPTASEEYRNSIIILQQQNGVRDDDVYICCKTSQQIYMWKRITTT